MFLGGSLRVSLIFSSTVCSFCFWAISDWVTSATFSFSLSSFSEVIIEEKKEEKTLSTLWRMQSHTMHPDVQSRHIRLPGFKITWFSFQSHFPPQFWAPKDTVHIFPLFSHCHGESQVLIKTTVVASKYLLQLLLGKTRFKGKAHCFYCYWIKGILYACGLYSRPLNLGNRYQL